MKSTTKSILPMINSERNMLMWLNSRRRSSMCSWSETRVVRLIGQCHMGRACFSFEAGTGVTEETPVVGKPQEMGVC